MSDDKELAMSRDTSLCFGPEVGLFEQGYRVAKQTGQLTAGGFSLLSLSDWSEESTFCSCSSWGQARLAAALS